MGRVSTELAGLTKGVIQPAKHVVKRLRQPVQFIAGSRLLEASRQVLPTDPASRLRHFIHRF